MKVVLEGFVKSKWLELANSSPSSVSLACVTGNLREAAWARMNTDPQAACSEGAWMTEMSAQ